MPHLHTGPGEHDHTASAYIVRMDGDTPKLMLHMHKKLNTYLQFGGHVELKETPWQAVLHEIREEAGYEPSQLKLLQPFVRLNGLTDADLHPYPVCQNTHKFDATHFHTDTVYAFVASEAPNLIVADGESSDMRLFDRAELESDSSLITNVREIGLFVLDTCLKEWELVALPPA